MYIKQHILKIKHVKMTLSRGTSDTETEQKCHHTHGHNQEFAKGDKRGGLGDESPRAGSRGRAPVEVWVQSPQKPETNAEYLTEQSHR